MPSANGCYAWYFREVPKIVPTRGCVTFEGKTLLYIGVAPDKQDKPDSRQTLRSRIKRHFRTDVKGLTLRRTLGVLLELQSGFPLRRVGSGISCPLNIKDNEQHPFVATLKAMRAEALRRAREKPIANE